MSREVYRLLLDARPLGAQLSGPELTEQGVISVAVCAGSPTEAEMQARAMLPALGWVALGKPARTSNLTRLLAESREDALDSAYGDYARQWLQIVHDEALAGGSAVHLLSLDYEYLDQPRRLGPPRRQAGD
jgi:hypothetical protein